MTQELPPVRCDDESTWRHKDEKIDLPRLLQLIEENGGPDDLDLHGCIMTDINARPEALRPYVNAYAQKHGADAWAPWITGYASLLRSKPTDGGAISLWGAHLEKARLDTAQMERANLATAHLEKAYLFDADLQNANLSSAHLQDANLSAAHLQNANLSAAHLQNARLIGTHLQNARLMAAHLEDADLSGAHLNGAFLQLAALNRTRFARACLGTAIGEELAARGHAPQPKTFYWAKETYLALKTNFDSIGRYADASWAYVKEQQMEKAMYFPTTIGHRWLRAELRLRQRRWRSKTPGPIRRFIRASIIGRAHWAWLHTRLLLNLCPPDIKRKRRGREHPDWPRSLEEQLDRPRWLRNWAYELLTGYGERPWNPVIIAGACMAAFAVGYWATAAVRGFWDAVAYSVATFATFNLARPATQPQGLGVEFASAVQAMLGIGLFALFVFTLGNRMRRS